MIHQFRNKKQIARRKKTIRILIIVLSIFFFLAFSGVLNFSSKIFNYIGLPVWEAKKIALDSTNKLDYLTRTKPSLVEDNKELVEENFSLKISMIDYQILKNENDKLKELLGRISTSYDFVLANILTKPNHSPYDTIIIDLGQNEKILEGSMVYANGNVPIGVISKVYENTSLVELYSNPGKVTVGLINDLNISVDLIGRGGGNFEMSVPLDLIILKGAVVVLPNIKSEIIAIAEEEISDPTDPVKKIILRSPVNIQNLKWLQIKKN